MLLVQIRHVPMVHVMHCEGRGWQFDANDEFSMELWGNHAIIRPVGELFVKFIDGDEYCWSTVRAPSSQGYNMYTAWIIEPGRV